jgi:hypothetical protein
MNTHTSILVLVSINLMDLRHTDVDILNIIAVVGLQLRPRKTDFALIERTILPVDTCGRGQLS